MIKTLKKRLSFIFAFSIMSIFTAVFGILIYKSIQVEQKADMNYFDRMVTHIVYQLENAENYNEILTTAEETYDFVLRYEDINGNTLYQSHLLNENTSNTLMGSLYAELDKVRTYPLDTMHSNQSGIFTLSTDNANFYYGIQATIITNNSSFYNLYCLVKTQNSFSIFKKHIPFYAIVWGLVFISILILTKIIIKTATKPTEITLQGQKEFIAAVSHELKTPLADILALAEIIGSSDDISIEIKKYTDTIDAECLRMSKLIQNLLLLSSIDANTWSLNKTEINVDNLLIQLFDKYESICRLKNISFKLDMADELLPPLLADIDRMEQILDIFIDNAINYSYPDSEIQLSVSMKKNFLSFQVTDHGKGIKDEDKPFIYDRFFCADKSRTQREHFGLGLSIAKELVSMHNGDITLFDTPNGGCTFIISIPL